MKTQSNLLQYLPASTYINKGYLLCPAAGQSIMYETICIIDKYNLDITKISKHQKPCGMVFDYKEPEYRCPIDKHNSCRFREPIKEKPLIIKDKEITLDKAQTRLGSFNVKLGEIFADGETEGLECRT